MTKINKYLVAILFTIPLIANASEVETEPTTANVPVTINNSPKLMYDFIPYIGAKVPDWITSVDTQVAKSNKIIKTFFYFESPNSYTFTVIDDILYSVEVRLGNYDFKNWTIENKYQKLGVASGIADSLQANGFAMSIDKTNTNVRYFQKGDVVVTLDNYKTQYKKDSNDSSILVSFTNNKVTEKIKKLEVNIVNQMAIEKQNEYRDLIGK